jgi:hypothetical protein
MLAHGAEAPLTTLIDSQAGLPEIAPVPRYVAAALKNVHLIVEKTTPPVQHAGEFWYWRLTPYGRDLMRMLVHASASGFAYAETFVQPEDSEIPQLTLLANLNHGIQAQMEHPAAPFAWTAVFEHSDFLQAQGVQIDLTVFQPELGRMIEQIRQDFYDAAGWRIYQHPRFVAMRGRQH